MLPFNIFDWYWYISGDQTKAYSSKSGDYVASDEATFQAWVLSGGVPTNIASESDLAGVLADASARPITPSILTLYQAVQASKFTLDIAAKVAFNHENRIRALEGKQPVTAGQFAGALKVML